MQFINDKIRVICETLSKLKTTTLEVQTGYEYIPCEYKTGETPPPPSAGWKEVLPGMHFGRREGHYWFHKKFTTPKAVEGCTLQYTVNSCINGNALNNWEATNPQAAAYFNGELVQGIDGNHNSIPMEFDKEYDVYLYFYTPKDDTRLELIPKLELVHVKLEKLFYDLSVPLAAANCLDPKSENHIRILKALEIAVGLLDMRVMPSAEFSASVDKTLDWLDKEFYHGICGTGSAGASEAIVSCIGHTHIDVAWLWILEQTMEKTQRSFATVTSLMKQYPEYVFMASQPQLYQYIKEQVPDLYAKIKKLVAEGRWEVEGAMWLESDCNLVSGESFVRQILHGKRFMKEEFGVDSRVLWLPDVFGYSAALPQILKKSGVEYFVTSKIGWNEYNKFPYDSFTWEGIDGSEVFTHYITSREKRPGETSDTACTYNAYPRPSQIIGCWERYQQKEYNNEALLTFGFGDGGGGPTKDMMEQMRRLSYGLPGFPKAKIQKAVTHLDNVRRNFQESAKKLKRHPKWVGELYLEFHRGTYTSIAKNKRNNRKSEGLLTKTETLSVIDKILLGGIYPQEELNRNWRVVLLNQFHDIIPGSSIFEVYEESDREYAKLFADVGAIAADKLKAISSAVNTDGGVLVYNPNGFVADGLVTVDGKQYQAAGIPAFGWKVVPAVPVSLKVKATEKSIENNHLLVTFDDQYNISSVYDKDNSREVILPGQPANRIELYEDFPRNWDAWEISSYHKQKKTYLDEVDGVKVLTENGRAGLEITRTFDQSTLTQRVWLDNEGRRVDFETTADWHQEHILVKAAFPFDVHAAKATYEIQFGNVERPTHENTSWDAARFEVVAHKWADISESGYGVSLMNDCKYGHSAEGSTLKLTLLKCATSPNPHADKGIHHFTYSILPHNGDYRASTINEAILMNNPLSGRVIGAQKGNLPAEYSLVTPKSGSFVLETIKKAEDDDSLILRGYEAHDARTPVTLEFGLPVQSVCLCDLMENELSALEIKDNKVSFTAKNFEIVTLKVKA